MLAIRANYVVNMGWIVVMLVLAAAISIFTGWAANSRDDSAISWETQCTVSAALTEAGAVTLNCPVGDDGETILASARNIYISLVGNTPISERADILANCRGYQSGRSTCQVGGEDDFYRFNIVTPSDEE